MRKELENFDERESLRNSLSSSSPAGEAAKDFLKRIRYTLSDKDGEDIDIEGMLQDAWDAVVDVAANTPHASQQLLVEILCAVQGEDLSTQFPEKVIVWGERVKMFEDLPLFGPSLRTAWNQIPGSGSQRCFTPEQWTNINAFVARLTALSSSLPVFDYSLYAIWSLRAVFEETEVDEALASAGEVWLQYSRAAIEKLSCAEKTFEGRLAAPGSKFRDKDWVGFNMERLGIWQAALELHSK